MAGALMALCCLAGPAVLGAVAGAAIGNKLGVAAAVVVAVVVAAGGAFVLRRRQRGRSGGC